MAARKRCTKSALRISWGLMRCLADAMDGGTIDAVGNVDDSSVICGMKTGGERKK